MLLGLVLAGAGFAGFYYLGTAHCRAMMRQPQPELAWLKEEFKLSDAESARITQLHEAYLPKCRERCRRIEEQNVKLQQLLAQSTNVTTEVQAVLAERARMRADCETEMLQHFLEVSRTMPQEQGRRYLAWVQAHIHSQAMFLLALNVFLLVVGSVVEIYAAIVILAPLIVPLGAAYGVNPIHLGIIFLANLELGYLTPPVGLNLYLASYRFEEPISRVYRDVLIFLAIGLAAVLLITYVPFLTMALL